MSERSLPSDRIILEGMQFYGFHGANPEERALGQSYVVCFAGWGGMFCRLGSLLEIRPVAEPVWL